MDKIWYRNPSKSEVIGRCGGNEKTEWPRRTDKSRTLKKKMNTLFIYIFLFFLLKGFMHLALMLFNLFLVPRPFALLSVITPLNQRDL